MKKTLRECISAFGAKGRAAAKRILNALSSPRFAGAFLTAVSFLLATLILIGASALAISEALCKKASPRIRSLEELVALDERFDLILVLGCRVNPDGRPSDMLYDRVYTAASLYSAGISDMLLMSGDSQDRYYDEVGTMRELALAMGVDADAILVDPYGLSTYESVVHLLPDARGKRVLIVTQEYHLYRALYIAEKSGLEAYGVSADTRSYSGQWKRDLREILARCKDVLFCAADDN